MIYFVSDIHLGAGTPEQAKCTEHAFCRWLDMVAEDATEIYLLGDIFDFWFEHRRVVPKGFVRVLGRLAKLSDSGVRIVLFTGNHDMWSREYLEEECGIEIYHRPEVMEISGRKVHVAHGDNINIDNKPLLRAMNAMFRSEVLRWMFSWLIHPDLALKFGAWWSGKSRKSHGSESITVDMLGYLVDYAREHKAHNANVELYIFGHMHLAHSEAIEGAEVLFLGDWSGMKAEYGAMSEDGKVELRDFEIYETIY